MSRESLREPTYLGEDYMVDQDLLKGPLSNRRCTDCLFLIIFIGFIGLMAYICSESVKNGDPSQLITPVDYDGKLCGLQGKEGYNYLYYILQATQ